MQLSASQIRRNFHRLRPNDAWSFRDVARAEMRAHTHSYHRYPAKFIPHLVQRLIRSYARKGNEVICDPFGGCGTTLVEAKISGRKSYGFDINPVAKLITEVKVTPISPKLLARYRTEFLVNHEKMRGKTIKHHARIKYWFDWRTVRALDEIYLAILCIKNPSVRKFFLCAFSHNLKNCSRWLMVSTKPQVDPEKVIPKPIESFLRHLGWMIQKNEEFYNELRGSERLKIPASMYRRDSTQTLPLKTSSVDLVITSPPYVTSYEYADLHQLSLLWFGDDPRNFKRWHKFSNEFNDFRKQFIGTSYKNARKKFFESDIADNIITALEKTDRRLATDVANYFSDMRKVFAEMHRILKVGGKACVIVGNTNMRGVDILNAEVAVEQMAHLGFKKVTFVKREISNKLITSWRDKETGKFTSLDNPAKKSVYGCEYVIVMRK